VADATDAVAICAALQGIDVVYHLVHSLGSGDFEERDRAAATAVADGAAAAGTTQIVYLGGLGDESSDLSPHLRSRAETAQILAGGPVPVTILHAAMIVGPGSTAFETILALVDRLPVMVRPGWVSVETQPVALADVLAPLVGVCGEPATYGEIFDVDGPEVMTYRTMMERVARLRGKHPILIEVPFLSPKALVLVAASCHTGERRGRASPRGGATDRPSRTTMRIWELVNVRRTTFDDAVDAALRERAL
jgi:uncharacterized protein YbjT (DUF2867 family)